MNQFAYACPDCGDNCEDFEMPEVVSDECINGQVDELSEINKIYLVEIDPTDPTKPKVWPANPASKADWEALIANTGADKIRRLYVSAEIPDPEKKTREYHSHKTKTVSRKYSLKAQLDNMHQTNYDAHRKLQCGGTVFIAFETIGGYMYGSENGIKCDIPDSTSAFAKGKDSYKSMIMQFDWNAPCDPDRIPSPFSESTTPPPSNP